MDPMSHTLGTVCQYATEHADQSCPEPGCEGNHGYIYLECPTPEACREYSGQCPVCNPSGVGFPDIDVPPPPYSIPPTVHVHRLVDVESAEPRPPAPAHLPPVPTGFVLGELAPEQQDPTTTPADTKTASKRKK